MGMMIFQAGDILTASLAPVCCGPARSCRLHPGSVSVHSTHQRPTSNGIAGAKFGLPVFDELKGPSIGSTHRNEGVLVRPRLVNIPTQCLRLAHPWQRQYRRNQRQNQKNPNTNSCVSLFTSFESEKTVFACVLSITAISVGEKNYAYLSGITDFLIKKRCPGNRSHTPVATISPN